MLAPELQQELAEAGVQLKWDGYSVTSSNEVRPCESSRYTSPGRECVLPAPAGAGAIVRQRLVCCIETWGTVVRLCPAESQTPSAKARVECSRADLDIARDLGKRRAVAEAT